MIGLQQNTIYHHNTYFCDTWIVSETMPHNTLILNSVIEGKTTFKSLLLFALFNIFTLINPFRSPCESN